MKNLIVDDLVDKFTSWFKSRGGYIHPHVGFKAGEWGLSVTASKPIHKDISLITCPFSLIITPEISQRALSTLSIDTSAWKEKQLICAYLVMHWILDEPRSSPFSHKPYLSVMPNPNQLRTSLHFSSEEMEALKGTNLHSATIDRQNDMRTDWLQCQSAFQSVEPDLAAKFTWDHYLSASTYLASRAFPSSILSATPTLIASPTSYPVLLPGIDSLNHARGQPVTWLVSYPNNSNGGGDLHVQKSADPTISLVLHTSAEPGDELFNNYGPKPNSELILAYGFTLPQNLDDTIVLKIGGHGDKWEVGRDTRGFEVVWDQVLNIMVQQSHQDDEEFDGDASFEDELDAADMLSEMLGTLLDRLPNNVHSELNIRPEVAEMIKHYVEGQRSILESTIEFTENRKRKAIEKAREQGVELVFDDVEE